MGEARDLAERFYDLFNRGHLDATRDVFSDDIENYDPTGTIQGWEGFRQYIGAFKQASPDAKLTVRTIVEGEGVAITEGTFTGTFTGPLPSPQGELPPTGKAFEVPFAEVNEARDGKIVSHRVYYDQMTLLTQFGAMQPPGS